MHVETWCLKDVLTLSFCFHVLCGLFILTLFQRGIAVWMNWPKPQSRAVLICEKLISKDGRFPVYMSGCLKSVEVLGIIYFMT